MQTFNKQQKTFNKWWLNGGQMVEKVFIKIECSIIVNR